MAVPNRPNERWSMNSVGDQLANGRRLRALNVVDDFTRECVLQVVDFSISGEGAARAFDQLIDSRSLPAVHVCDNGPEFTGKAMFFSDRRCAGNHWDSHASGERKTRTPAIVLADAQEKLTTPTDFANERPYGGSITLGSPGRPTAVMEPGLGCRPAWIFHRRRARIDFPLTLPLCR